MPRSSTTTHPMLSTHPGYRARLAANVALLCIVPGCCRPRVFFESSCSTHAHTAKRLGHPMARPVARRSWAPYRGALQDLWSLPANAEHEGLLHWSQWCDELLDKAKLDPSKLSKRSGAAPELAHLAEAGICGRQILETAVAFGCWSLQHGQFPSLRASDFALALAVLRLVPPARSRTGWPKAYRRGALAWLGKALRQELSSLTAMTANALERQAKRKARTREEVAADRLLPFASA